MSTSQEQAVGANLDLLTRLRELEDLFSHRWDALAMLCLSDGPLRFNRLAATMNERADERLADGVLSRSLHRLSDKRMVVRAEVAESGHIVYALTDEGRARAQQLADYVRAVTRLHSGR